MYWEVIGCEGSGKTTVCGELRQLSRRTIKTWDDIKLEAVKSFIHTKEIELNGFDLGLLALSRLNKNILHYLIQTKLKFDSRVFDAGWEEFLVSLLKVRAFKSRERIECFLPRMNWLVSAIFKARVSSFYRSEERVILLDEGATHYAAPDKRLWGKCPMPDGLLFVNTDPDVAFEGILERRMRQLNRGHRFLEKDEIYRRVLEQDERFGDFMKHLSGKIPCIVEYRRGEGEAEQVLAKIEEYSYGTKAGTNSSGTKI